MAAPEAAPEAKEKNIAQLVEELIKAIAAVDRSDKVKVIRILAKYVPEIAKHVAQALKTASADDDVAAGMHISALKTALSAAGLTIGAASGALEAYLEAVILLNAVGLSGMPLRSVLSSATSGLWNMVREFLEKHPEFSAIQPEVAETASTASSDDSQNESMEAKIARGENLKEILKSINLDNLTFFDVDGEQIDAQVLSIKKLPVTLKLIATMLSNGLSLTKAQVKSMDKIAAALESDQLTFISTQTKYVLDVVLQLKTFVQICSHENLKLGDKRVRDVRFLRPSLKALSDSTHPHYGVSGEIASFIGSNSSTISRGETLGTILESGGSIGSKGILELRDIIEKIRANRASLVSLKNSYGTGGPDDESASNPNLDHFIKEVEKYIAWVQFLIEEAEKIEEPEKPAAGSRSGKKPPGGGGAWVGGKGDGGDGVPPGDGAEGAAPTPENSADRLEKFNIETARQIYAKLRERTPELPPYQDILDGKVTPEQFHKFFVVAIFNHAKPNQIDKGVTSGVTPLKWASGRLSLFDEEHYLGPVFNEGQEQKASLNIFLNTFPWHKLYGDPIPVASFAAFKKMWEFRLSHIELMYNGAGAIYDIKEDPKSPAHLEAVMRLKVDAKSGGGMNNAIYSTFLTSDFDPSSPESFFFGEKDSSWVFPELVQYFLMKIKTESFYPDGNGYLPGMESFHGRFSNAIKNASAELNTRYSGQFPIGISDMIEMAGLVAMWTFIQNFDLYTMDIGAVNQRISRMFCTGDYGAKVAGEDNTNERWRHGYIESLKWLFPTIDDYVRMGVDLSPKEDPITGSSIEIYDTLSLDELIAERDACPPDPVDGRQSSRRVVLTRLIGLISRVSMSETEDIASPEFLSSVVLPLIRQKRAEIEAKRDSNTSDSPEYEMFDQKLQKLVGYMTSMEDREISFESKFRIARTYAASQRYEIIRIKPEFSATGLGGFPIFVEKQALMRDPSRVSLSLSDIVRSQIEVSRVDAVAPTTAWQDGYLGVLQQGKPLAASLEIKTKDALLAPVHSLMNELIQHGIHVIDVIDPKVIAKSAKLKLLSSPVPLVGDIHGLAHDIDHIFTHEVVRTRDYGFAEKDAFKIAGLIKNSARYYVDALMPGDARSGVSTALALSLLKSPFTGGAAEIDGRTKIFYSLDELFAVKNVGVIRSVLDSAPVPPRLRKAADDLAEDPTNNDLVTAFKNTMMVELTRLFFSAYLDQYRYVTITDGQPLKTDKLFSGGALKEKAKLVKTICGEPPLDFAARSVLRRIFHNVMNDFTQSEYTGLNPQRNPIGIYDETDFDAMLDDKQLRNNEEQIIADLTYYHGGFHSLHDPGADKKHGK